MRHLSQDPRIICVERASRRHRIGSSYVLSPLLGFWGNVRMAWLRNWVCWVWACSAGTPGNHFGPSSAIDYGDSTMLQAKHLLLGVAAFVQDARAYMKGQLACGPIREDVLWER